VSVLVRLMQPPTYRLISVGVNEALGLKPLRYAERDATSIARVFASGVGPLTDADVTLLRGYRATSHRLNLALGALAYNRPDHLVVYISSHGNELGVALVDGPYSFAALAEWLRRIGSPHTMVILDTCHAAAYARYAGIEVGGLAGILDLPWIVALAHATPGSRLMFSTGAKRTASEGGRVRHGHFTWALLRALANAPGDLRAGGECWISDAAAFAQARARMIQVFGPRQVPQAIGLTGDFPLAMSQAHAAVGDASIDEARLVSTSGQLAVEFCVTGRRHLPTHLRWSLRNAAGAEIAADTVDVATADDRGCYRGRISLPLDAAQRDRITRLLIRGRGRAPLAVTLSVEDHRARPLARTAVPLAYTA
jgi:hypothetical protein